MWRPFRFVVKIFSRHCWIVYEWKLIEHTFPRIFQEEKNSLALWVFRVKCEKFSMHSWKKSFLDTIDKVGKKVQIAKLWIEKKYIVCGWKGKFHSILLLMNEKNIYSKFFRVSMPFLVSSGGALFSHPVEMNNSVWK